MAAAPKKLPPWLAKGMETKKSEKKESMKMEKMEPKGMQKRERAMGIEKMKCGGKVKGKAK